MKSGSAGIQFVFLLMSVYAYDDRRLNFILLKTQPTTKCRFVNILSQCCMAYPP